MYYVLKLKGNVSLTDRKKYVNSLWGAREKLGMMQKFAKSVKFTSKTEDEVKSVLYGAIHAKPYGDTLVEFHFKQDSIDVAKKFTKFLTKVYPQVSVETDGAFAKPNALEFVMSYIFSSLTDFPVTVECSLSEPLNETELEQVKTLIEDIKVENLYYICRQFKCDTCEEYHPDKPIHFEIDNHYKFSHVKKKREKLGLNVDDCFYCKKEVKGDFCEECAGSYTFKI